MGSNPLPMPNLKIMKFKYLSFILIRDMTVLQKIKKEK